jgi:hypothetical protein
MGAAFAAPEECSAGIAHLRCPQSTGRSRDCIQGNQPAVRWGYGAGRLFYDFYPGLVFERAIVERLAKYGLSVDFDFYGWESENARPATGQTES